MDEEVISKKFFVQDIHRNFKFGIREIANSPESATRIPGSYISDSRDRFPLTNEPFCTPWHYLSHCDLAIEGYTINEI